MATANISWTPCGSASDGQYLYYGKTNIATGTPISGTGWTLYSGVPLTNSANSVTINGLDDNVEYTFYIYCHCTTSGNGPLTQSAPIIKYVCPTFSNITPIYNGVSYNLSIPTSANNTGSWIQNVEVSVYDSSNITKLYTNTYSSPFAIPGGSFNNLNSSTNYNLQISYTNNATPQRVNLCTSVPFTTSAACTAPTITVNNATANTFDVNWTPGTGGTFDILVNSSVVATGITTSPYTVTNLTPATLYQVNVRKNCTTGGTGISTTQNITTSNATLNGVISMNIPVSYAAAANYTDAPVTLAFNFPTATPSPITLYFAATWENSCNSCTSGKCLATAGFDIISGTPNTCPGGTISGLPEWPSQSNYPLVVNIPQGVTTYSATNIQTTVGHQPFFPLYFAAANPNPGGGTARGFTDLYVKVNSPAGYSANFTISNGTNITGVIIHNVS